MASAAGKTLHTDAPVTGPAVGGWRRFCWVTGRRTAMGLAAMLFGLAAVVAISELQYVYFNREKLPDLGVLRRFDFPTIGRVYDVNGEPLIELAREYRTITHYRDIPPVVRDAILAAEDKRFFAHNGIDTHSLPRMIGKVRLGSLARQFFGGATHDVETGALFPQGGSTITQQLVRGSFLQRVTAAENSDDLHHRGFPAVMWSTLLGARSVNMLARKREEIRLALWLEQDLRAAFGSKRRAKEEILARYASVVYMGNGQYGFARAAEYYFGRRLASFTVNDADKAAVLAGIPKSPRDYAPTARDSSRVIRRRNQTLVLMQAAGFLSVDATARATRRALQVERHQSGPLLSAPFVVEHALAELRTHYPVGSVDDLLVGRVQVYATADARVQQVVNDALERGLSRYESRHRESRGMTQGSVVVLHNSDGRILAEAGGRQTYQGRLASYTDLNRVTGSRRQPGSAMKPLVYLSAFRHGAFTLDTPVPDFPISVANGDGRPPKWIANYDGQFKGLISMRQALAESRNAVAMWLTARIGITAVLTTARTLGVTSPLAEYPTTALGASEMTLLELANAYRTIASGLAAEPYVIGSVVRESGSVIASTRVRPVAVSIGPAALGAIQEGLRGVIRLPSGTAHTLDSSAFPIAVMGKTGTTNEFRDAIFVGSTFGVGGITVAVRIGFDDHRPLGARETGGRVALPVFRDVMLGVYRDGLAGPAPPFPPGMEGRITAALLPRLIPPTARVANNDPPALLEPQPWAVDWLLRHGSTHQPTIVPRPPGPPPW